MSAEDAARWAEKNGDAQMEKVTGTGENRSGDPHAGWGHKLRGTGPIDTSGAIADDRRKRLKLIAKE